MLNTNRVGGRSRSVLTSLWALALLMGVLAAPAAAQEEGPDECWDGFAALDMASEGATDLLFGLWGCPVGPATVTVDDNSDPTDGVLFSGMWYDAGSTQFLFAEFDLQVGHFVRVESLVFDLSKEVELDVRITAVDTDENTVSGTAVPGAHLQIEIPAPAPIWTVTGRSVVADAAGNWSVDFDSSGPDYEWGPGEVDEGAPMFPYRHVPYDLVAGSRVLAAAYDSDGDFASTQFVVPGVSGVVLLDGEPLAGVEVSVWTPFASEFQGWSTCTDGAGRFEFADVPPGVELWAATGPAWAFGCENAKFFDPASIPARPLMSQFYDHSNASAAVVSPTAFSAPNSEIVFDVIRLPNDYLDINSYARQAMIACFDRADAARATAFLDKLLEEVEKYEVKGRIDAATAGHYRTYHEIVSWSTSAFGTCQGD